MVILTRIIRKFGSFRPSLFAVAAGLAVSLTAAGLIASWESRHAAAQFHVVAENHFTIVQNGLNEYVNRMRAVRALVNAETRGFSRRARAGRTVKPEMPTMRQSSPRR